MTLGKNMKTKQLITRREALITGLASVGGLLLSGCSKKLPPTYGNICVWATLSRMPPISFSYRVSLGKEYSHKDISSFPATGTTNPGDPTRYFSELYANLQGGFADWRISIEGLVARPGFYSLADLKRWQHGNADYGNGGGSATPRL